MVTWAVLSVPGNMIILSTSYREQLLFTASETLMSGCRKGWNGEQERVMRTRCIAMFVAKAD